MEKVTGKFLRGMRKAVAVTVAAAMAVSALGTVPQSEAASVKKPTISVKKKTLYYNKAGKKTFTLKIKKNQTKKITQTTWKTSKKSVVAISKKTKTSVKLTAKKKGTSTISAVVKYIPKGSKVVKKVKLTCKVTSKAAATPKPTPKKTKAPTKKPTQKPDETEEPDESDTPENPVIKGQAASVDLMASVFLSTAEGKNTANLSAVIKDSEGSVIDDQDITWTSDNETVAKVDDQGVVTAVSDGTANVTAKAGEVSSKPCIVTVDSVAPTVKEVQISDYKTIMVFFGEKVKGEPKVSVTKGESKEALNNITAALSENGMSVALTTSEESLAASVYKLSVSGITDLAGNELQGGSDLTVEKEESVMAGFVSRIDIAPASQKSIKVFYTVTDQYKQPFEVMSANGLSVAAKTEGGMPLSANVNNDGKNMGYVSVSGSAGIFTVGRKIIITLTNKLSDTVSYSGEISVSLVDASGLGVAKDFSKLYVASEKMVNDGSDEEPVFMLTETDADNIFTLNASLLDEFLYPADKSEVTYVLSSTDIVRFSDVDDTTETIKTSDSGVSFKALKGGVATVTAYLVNDDTKTRSIKIQIKPTKLKKIHVAEINEEGINGRTTETEVSFEPIGTGLTEKDLYIDYTENEERVDKEKSGLVSVTDKDGNKKIYARITVKTDSGNGIIKFRIGYKGETEEDNVLSDEVAYVSKPLSTVASIDVTPFSENEVTVSGDAETEFILKNTYGEDITAITAQRPEAETDKPDVISITSIGGVGEDYNKLKVTGVTQGDAKITVSIGNIKKTVNVSVAEAAQLKNVVFDKKEAEIIRGDYGADDVIYVELTASNQFGNPYQLKRKDLEGMSSIKKGSDDSTDIVVGFYKKDAENNYIEKNGADDVIDAIGIKWNNRVTALDNDKITVSFEMDGVKSDSIILTVKPERMLSKLIFEKAEVVAVAGASVSNTVKGEDQYGKEVDLTTYEVTPVIKDSTGNQTSGVLNMSIAKGIDKTVLFTAPLTSGTYSVTVTVKASNNADVTLSSVPKFKLVVGTVLELVKKIELDKVVTVSEIDYDTSKYDVDLRGDLSSSKTIEYKYKLYDKDNKEIQCDAGILNNNLSWSYQEAKGITVESVDADGIVVKRNVGAEDGSVTVKLSCMAGTLLTAYLPINVSAKDDEVQGNDYTLKHIVPDGIPAEMEIPKDGSGKFDISGNYEISVYATNQYGQPFPIDKTKMIGAISASPDIASVTISDSGVISIVPVAEGNAKIMVYVTEDNIFEFTVAVKRTASVPTDVPTGTPTVSPSGGASESPSASASAGATASAEASPSASASENPSVPEKKTEVIIRVVDGENESDLTGNDDIIDNILIYELDDDNEFTKEVYNASESVSEFDTPKLLIGSYKVYVKVKDDVDYFNGEYQFTVSQEDINSGTKDVQVELYKTTKVTIDIQYDDGSPVTGIDVEEDIYLTSDDAPNSKISCTYDSSDGTYSAILSKGAYTIIVQKSGCVDRKEGFKVFEKNSIVSDSNTSDYDPSIVQNSLTVVLVKLYPVTIEVNAGDQNIEDGVFTLQILEWDSEQGIFKESQATVDKTLDKQYKVSLPSGIYKVKGTGIQNVTAEQRFNVMNKEENVTIALTPVSNNLEDVLINVYKGALVEGEGEVADQAAIYIFKKDEAGNWLQISAEVIEDQDESTYKVSLPSGIYKAKVTGVYGYSVEEKEFEVQSGGGNEVDIELKSDDENEENTDETSEP